MKKRVAISCLCLVGFLVLAWGMGGRTGYDYGLTCTKCLEDYHVIEKRFLVVTYRRSLTLQHQSRDYFEITGQECQHVFHKGGFGKSLTSWRGDGISCGMTGEGAVFRDRNHAILRTFALNRTIGNTNLALKTLGLIDKLLPPELDWKKSHGSDNDSRQRLLCLGMALDTTNSQESWIRLLDIAEHGTLIELSYQITQQPAPSAGAKPQN